MFALIKKKIDRQLPVDLGWSTRSTVLISGMGRSGTTWLSSLINHRGNYRDIFEPFSSEKVDEAQPFKGMPYLRPECDDVEKVRAARKILMGRIARSAWTDNYNVKNVFIRRIVKDIRTNLILGWIRRHFPKMPIVLLMRHPCAVANSWRKLGWIEMTPGKKTGLEECLEQQELVDDHLSDLVSEIRRHWRSDYDRVILTWCILNLVPLRQLNRHDCHVLFYEDLVSEPIKAAKALFSYLGEPISDNLLREKSLRPSAQSRNHSAVVRGGDPVSAWLKEVSSAEIDRAVSILELFGLDGIYSADVRPHRDALKSFGF